MSGYEIVIGERAGVSTAPALRRRLACRARRAGDRGRPPPARLLVGHLNRVVVVLNSPFLKGFDQVCDRRTQHHVIAWNTP
jgi:hypothetical protein